MDLRLLSQGHLQSAGRTACDSHHTCPVCTTLVMDDQLPGSAPRLLAWLTRATRRGRDAQVHALGLENSRDAVPMSVFWLVPQYAIIGAAEILVNIGARTSARRHGYGRVRVGFWRRQALAEPAAPAARCWRACMCAGRRGGRGRDRALTARAPLASRHACCQHAAGRMRKPQEHCISVHRCRACLNVLFACA